MGYQHINNLYKTKDILEFKKCFALEKIHGTSAHVGIDKDCNLRLFSGGEKHQKFVDVICNIVVNHQRITQDDASWGLDEAMILDNLKSRLLPYGEITLYGEAYGGSCQKMSNTYGPVLRFIVFDVKIGDKWLSVPDAHKVTEELGFEFVHYVEIETKLELIDAERDADSVQAIRNGMGPGHKREGVVLRPPFEATKNNGDRITAKHKRDEFMETSTPRKVDEGKLAVLSEAKAVADEWCTRERLHHVLDKLPEVTGMESTKIVIAAMLEDVKREGEGEIVWSREVETAVGKLTASLLKEHFASTLKG